MFTWNSNLTLHPAFLSALSALPTLNQSPSPQIWREWERPGGFSKLCPFNDTGPSALGRGAGRCQGIFPETACLSLPEEDPVFRMHPFPPAPLLFLPM